MNNSSIVDNNINLHGYNKNWRYGTDGGSFVIHNSKFLSKINKQILLSKITDASGKKIHKNLENFTTNKNVFITKNNLK